MHTWYWNKNIAASSDGIKLDYSNSAIDPKMLIMLNSIFVLLISAALLSLNVKFKQNDEGKSSLPILLALQLFVHWRALYTGFEFIFWLIISDLPVLVFWGLVQKECVGIKICFYNYLSWPVIVGVHQNVNMFCSDLKISLHLNLSSFLSTVVHVQNINRSQICSWTKNKIIYTVARTSMWTLWDDLDFCIKMVIKYVPIIKSHQTQSA